MIQATMRQQILAGILVSGCFLVGAVCEHFLQLKPLQTSESAVIATLEPTTRTTVEAVQLTNR
jgi:hypothetical protein